MAAVVVIGLVVLVFFLAGAVVGALSLVAMSFWNVRRKAPQPWPRGGSAQQRRLAAGRE